MPDQPTWRTSTLSQAFLLTSVWYMGLMTMVTGGLIWSGLNIEIAKLIIGWASALQGAVMAAYLAVRNTTKHATGGAHEAVPKP